MRCILRTLTVLAALAAPSINAIPLQEGVKLSDLETFHGDHLTLESLEYETADGLSGHESRDLRGILYEIKAEGKSVGSAGISRTFVYSEAVESTEGAELVLFINPDQWHKGYGKRATAALLALLKSRTDVKVAIWECNPDNQWANKIATGLGFEFIVSYKNEDGRMVNRYQLRLVKA